MTDEEKAEKRRMEKERRIKEKMMRMPVNDVVLEIQKGYISLESFFKHIDLKLAEKAEEKKNA